MFTCRFARYFHEMLSSLMITFQKLEKPSTKPPKIHLKLPYENIGQNIFDGLPEFSPVRPIKI